MYGAILGDIVGSVYEWHNIKTKDFPFLRDGCHFTDDSVMTIAVAEALLDSMGKGEAEHKKALAASMQKWGKRYPDAGYGGRFRDWLCDPDPQPYNSWGNGSAMRVASAGWLYDSLEETLEKAKWTAEVTHNHPEGIRGAQAVAAAIFLARKGRSKEEIKAYITDHFYYDLNQTCDQIRPKYKFDVSCQGSVPQAIIAFLEGNDYVDAVRNAISLGGDSDTIACITGSIAEAFWGMGFKKRGAVENRLPHDMAGVLHRYLEYMNRAFKNWIRKVAAGEAEGDRKVSAEDAKKLAARWGRKQEVFLALKKGYETGDFTDVKQYLTDDSIFESQWVLEPLTGTDEIMGYLLGKGKTLQKHNAFAEATFPGGTEGEYMLVTQGEDEMGIEVQLDDQGMVQRIDLVLP